MVEVNLSGISGFLDAAAMDYSAAANAHRMLMERTGPGSELTGWLKLPEQMLDGQFRRIQSLAERIRAQSQVLVVVGVGGSYLGARAGLELICSPNYNLTHKDGPDIFFAGESLSPSALAETLDLIGERDFSVNLISKSGKTIETSLAFRILREKLEKKFGAAGAKKRIYVTTGPETALHHSAEADGWELLELSDSVGGRYSVLSPVGLLPLACAGIDIEKLLIAANSAMQELGRQSPLNPAWQYAAARQQLYALGRSVEILCSFEPHFRSVTEWWKQLFGESEGKNGVGIFPASLIYSTDLHSMGQYLQEGPRCMFESIVSFRSAKRDLKIPFAMGDRDTLNYLAGKSLNTVNKAAEQAARDAHIAGGVPVIGISVENMDEAGFAELVCFFEVACALSGYILGVNPFDQPGVEYYKQNMHRLLEAAE